MLRNLCSVDQLEVGGIPCLYLRPKRTLDDWPTVFLYHGWSSKKENYKFMGEIIAQYGYQVIIPDALHHGERGLLDYENPQVMEKYFWQVAINSVEEFSILLAEAGEELNCHPPKIAVMGHSMGGIVSGGIFVKHPEIQTTIVMNGACAWEDVEARVRIARDMNRIAGISVEKLRQYDPYQQLAKFFPRPILIQHGEDDQMVPMASQVFFYQELAPFYQDKPDNIRFTKAANLNHYKTLAMLEEAIIWLDNIFYEDK